MSLHRVGMSGEGRCTWIKHISLPGNILKVHCISAAVFSTDFPTATYTVSPPSSSNSGIKELIGRSSPFRKAAAEEKPEWISSAGRGVRRDKSAAIFDDFAGENEVEWWSWRWVEIVRPTGVSKILGMISKLKLGVSWSQNYWLFCWNLVIQADLFGNQESINLS